VTVISMVSMKIIVSLLLGKNILELPLVHCIAYARSVLFEKK